jgi:FSR family fosmidomycin resistance protein-like MFS transporter
LGAGISSTTLRPAPQGKRPSGILRCHTSRSCARWPFSWRCSSRNGWVYLASFTSFYVFYLKDKFGLPTQEAQIYQFVFFAAVAAGTVAGGPIGDRLGRKPVIWVSILGILPFTLILPHVGLAATAGLSVAIGFILASAFPAIVVFGQELMPGRVGMVSGLFFGFIFGIGGIGAATLGTLADWKGINFVYQVCAFLPAIGVLTVLLPSLKRR